MDDRTDDWKTDKGALVTRCLLDLGIMRPKNPEPAPTRLRRLLRSAMVAGAVRCPGCMTKRP